MRSKKKRLSSINSALFKTYIATMIIVLLSVTLFFTIVQIANLNQNIRSNILQTGKSVAQSVDSEIKQMDTLSINTLYSNLIKDSFKSYIDFEHSKSGLPNWSAYYQNSNAEVLTDLLYALIGANHNVKQLNLYNLDKGGFGIGRYNGYLDEDVKEKNWFAATKEKDGYRFLTTAEKNNSLFSTLKTDQNRYSISLCRLYFDKYNRANGLIEVVQYYDIVFSSALNPNSSYNPSIYIYDTDGRLLFPSVEPLKKSFNYFEHYNDSGQVHTLKNTVKNSLEYVSYEKLDYSGLLVATVVDNANFYAPIIQFLWPMLILIGIISIFCYFIALQLSRRLSAPLLHIHAHLSQIDFNASSWPQLEVADSNIIEFNELHTSINTFQSKLKASTDNIILLQKQESQSQMLALQSQMNPHFLYNSLSTISAMAEEGMVDGVAEMCSAITGILRYISSNKENMVSLEDELENADRYIQCLQFRYSDNIHFTIDVDDSMLTTPVPKLCIQLLVENAVKFATQSIPPPWEISISCIQVEDIWTVTVLDNGLGFSEETMLNIHKKIQDIEKTELLPSLELQGMGLLNIFIRLHLLYKEDYIFEFGNRLNGGAFVRIGGKTDERPKSF